MELVKLCFVSTIALFFLAPSSFAQSDGGNGNITASANPNVDSIFQFGDSLVDTGNSILVPIVGPLERCAHLPYGQTYGKATGRYSDGLLTVDYLALAVGLPLLNPYLNKAANFSNGVNFATAGSTALDFAFFTARGIKVPFLLPLSTQVDWFKDHLATICSSPKECSRKLANSLVWVGGIGGNDIKFLFLQKPFRQIRIYVPYITQAIIRSIRKMIQLGATKIVVPGYYPTGCFPPVFESVASKNKSADEFDEFGCSKSFNELAIYHNNYLKSELATLSLEFPNVRLIYADSYGAFMSLLTRASLLGFDTGGSLFKTCCGGRRDLKPTIIPVVCGDRGARVCPNPSRFIIWDGVHFTQEAYRRISEFLIPTILQKIQ